MSSKRPASDPLSGRATRARRHVTVDEEPTIKQEKLADDPGPPAHGDNAPGVGTAHKHTNDDDDADADADNDDVVSVAYSEDARIVDDIDDGLSVIAEDGETIIGEGEEHDAVAIGAGPAVDPQALAFDIWVDLRSLRNIRRYVQTNVPQEALFSLAMIPLDNCAWLPDGTLGYQEIPVRLRTVGTVVGQAFHADVLHYPEFVCRIELPRAVDKSALRRIYHTCVPHKPVPPYFEAYKRYGQHSSSFESVYNSSEGIRAGNFAKTLPFTSVLIGSVVLVESTVRRIAGGMEFTMTAIHRIAPAPIDLT